MSRAGEMGEEYRVIRELKFDVQSSKFRKLRTTNRLSSRSAILLDVLFLRER
jgi:hypothetical protein